MHKPPLYKAKIGKKEEYLKDERSFKKFLFDWARDHAVLSIDGVDVIEETWQKELEALLVYNTRLEETAQKFKLAYDNTVELIAAMKANNWQPDQGLDALIVELQKHFTNYTVQIKHTEATEDRISKTMISFKLLNDEWMVSADFFASNEARILLEQTKVIAAP